MHTRYGKLFLIPNFLAEDNPPDFLPEVVRRSVNHLQKFIVENEKAGRALIKKLSIATPQNELVVRLWNEQSQAKDLAELLELFENGNDVGLITDAGIPCVA